jgi:hypothetical protein
VVLISNCKEKAYYVCSYNPTNGFIRGKSNSRYQHDAIFFIFWFSRLGPVQTPEGRRWGGAAAIGVASIGFLLRTDNLSAVGGHPSFWEERQEQGAYP